MKKHVLIFLLLLTSAAALSFIQDDSPLEKLLLKIEKYRSQYPQEKIHIHTDKPYYAIGDQIWFKTYVVNADQNTPSNLSNVVYVELISEKDSIKKSVMLPLIFGTAAGDFMLADTLSEGNYRIRAYTTWMRNFGEEYFFDKTISIGNSVSNRILTEAHYSFSKEPRGEKVTAELNFTNLEGEPFANKEVNYQVDLDFRNILKGKGTTDSEGNLTVTFLNTQPFILKSGKLLTTIKIDENTSARKTFIIKSTSGEADVQFFPESGNLVAGIPAKVGFKAVGPGGLGIQLTGYVTDENNRKIAELKAEHAGMGSFPIVPERGGKYTAHLQFEDGSEKTYPLPAVDEQGYVISVDNNNKDHLNVKIFTTEEPKPDAELSLIAQSNGRVYYISRNKLNAKNFSAKIPKEKFPTGILQLTLFSANNEPVAERLVFINHADFLKIDMSTAKEVYGKREKVEIEIDAKDLKGLPTAGSFSISVIDESKVPFDDANEVTIISNLLLSSDLKGFVEKPNYYFENFSAERARQLDNLMLTQGWRRFEWKKVLSDYYPPLVYKPEINMSVSGKVTTMAGRPVHGGKVTLFSASGTVLLLDTLTDANGEFNFDNLYFNDSTSFVVQARNERDRKNVQVVLNRIPPQLVTANKNAAMVEVNVNKSMLSYLENSKNQFDELRRYGLITRSIMLEEVKVVEKKPDVTYSSNLNGAGRADAVIKRDQLQYCYDLSQCIQGRVAGVIVRNGIAYSMRSMNSSFSGPVPMQLIIDGMMVEPQFLSSINPNDVETIEVLKSGAMTAIYGMNGGGGVLIVNTIRGKVNRDYRSYAPGIASYKPQGYYKAREFYSPNYDDPELNTKMSDLRTTIYWNPQVITDAQGKARVQYFNADGTGTYKVVIEGINAEGQIGRKVFRYTVK